MSLILSLHALTKSYGSAPLFKELTFSIRSDEKIGLIGPNGSGKSTLLKILAKEISPEEGFLTERQGLKIGYSCQNHSVKKLTCLDSVLSQSQDRSSPLLQLRAKTLLSKAFFPDPNLCATTLSGGWRKRLEILGSLIDDPELLLLDEPTNHLDLEGIWWLEEFLKKERSGFLLVSHDRSFLSATCTRIVEIDRSYRKGFLETKGSYADHLLHRESTLAVQTERARSLRSTVSLETEWLRRSPKARTKKSQSRIDNAYNLQEELGNLQKCLAVQKIEVEFHGSARETQNLLIGRSLAKTVGDKPLFERLDLNLHPGTRLGIVGPNGCGKTTLMRILYGEILSDSGTIKRAENLRSLWFDQHRESLPPECTVREALSPEGDFLSYQGEKIHVSGWAKRFLFDENKLLLPIRELSGGELARIHLAKLMLLPADLLFLDEPTNDLDIPTLEILEKSLATFPGALVLISHDQSLMTNICDTILCLGISSKPEFVAGGEQWQQLLKKALKKQSPVKAALTARRGEEPSLATGKERLFCTNKGKNTEKKDLQQIEKTLFSLEKRLRETELFLAKALEEQRESLSLYKELASLQEKIDALYQRWESLESDNL